MKRYQEWLMNAPVQKKFLPTQIATLAVVLIIGVISVWSIISVNNMSHKVFNENVNNTEQLNTIIRTMYMCRVDGRDILLHEDEQVRKELYEQYIEDFHKLDKLMDEYLAELSGDKKVVFEDIIAQKEIYKEYMILSADIRLDGGDYNAALNALQLVTPIATEFFDSMDDFLEDEKQLMQEVLDTNSTAVEVAVAVAVFVNGALIILLFLMMQSFGKSMSSNLVALEKSVSVISKTGNMKAPIPEYLFTNDEVGNIAKVVEELKEMLVEYSFKDSLTGGFNVKAYHSELLEIFDERLNNVKKTFWCAIFDMNNLKNINDEHGHINGDAVIKQAHNILSACFDDYGKVFRVGGDEFVAILQGCTAEDIERGINNMNEIVDSDNKNAKYYFSIASGYDEFVGYTREEFNLHFSDVDKKMYKNKDELKQLRQLSRVVPIDESGEEA